jgi:hypothetical protein
MSAYLIRCPSSTVFCIIKVDGKYTGHMTAEKQLETHKSLSKVIIYCTVIFGFVAANLTYPRGESMLSIARKTVSNRVGSLVSEVKNVV